MLTRQNFKKINDYLWEIPKSFRSDMQVPARIYADEKMLDQISRDKSLEQLVNVAVLPGIQKYALAMPDCHEGYASPIGGVAAIKISEGIISPGMQGYDVNCGMKLLRSSLSAEEIGPYLENLADKIYEKVPSGLGQGQSIKLDVASVDEILERGAQKLVEQGYGTKSDLDNCEAGGRLAWADASVVSKQAKSRGRDQVGTLGSGNHFLEIQKVERVFDAETAKSFGLFEGQIVIMIHTGSRGLGHQVCTDNLREFIPLMQNKYKIKVPDREFACVPFNSPEGQRGLAASAAAANYAWANRQMIAHLIRKAWKEVLTDRISDLEVVYDVAHNIIKKEKYDFEGKEVEIAVHRKGATRAFPPGHFELPEAYRRVGQPVLIPGSMGTASYVLVGAEKGKESFYSVNHGAGRKMSRHAAIGAIRGEEVVKHLKEKGILVKCRSMRGIAEEAPAAYKDVDQIVETVERAGLAKKVARLVPLAVIKGE